MMLIGLVHALLVRDAHCQRQHTQVLFYPLQHQAHLCWRVQLKMHARVAVDLVPQHFEVRKPRTIYLDVGGRLSLRLVWLLSAVYWPSQPKTGCVLTTAPEQMGTPPRITQRRGVRYSRRHMRPNLHPPSVEAFARIGALEAIVRGTTLSVYPLIMYRAWGSAAVVAQIYFAIGVVSLLTALMVPALARVFRRLPVYYFATTLYLVSAGFGMLGGTFTTPALLCGVMAAAMSFVCFNAYVLDYVSKTEFGKLETLRMFYGGVGWVVGPVLGVWLLSVSEAAPFVVVALTVCAMLVLIYQTRLGNGKDIVRAPRPSDLEGGLFGGGRSNPLAHVRRFFAQPRLVTGWLIPVLRSCGWWFYFVYIGIFALENGLGEKMGGLATSLANMGLFLAPLMLRWMRKRSVRQAVRAGCLFGGVCFVAGTLVSPWPWATVAVLVLGTYFLVLLDTCAGLPFLMSVKPSERTEMSAVYSSFRDVSGIVSPGIAWLVLQFFPLVGVFAVAGLALLGGWLLAGRLHPQLGVPGAHRVRDPARLG
jgi:MFS family permease